MDNMKNVLHMDNVTMQFGGVVAVIGLSLDVNEREIVALIGPNGAGKTTAFNCVTGIYQPTYGSVSFNGEMILADTPQGKMRRLYAGDVTPKALTPVRKTPDEVTKLGIARTFQNIRLFGNLTVFDNVLIAKHMRARQNVFSATLRLGVRLMLFLAAGAVLYYGILLVFLQVKDLELLSYLGMDAASSGYPFSRLPGLLLAPY